MSFWENNKGTFKLAGIASAKAIGSGTKALGKAGYKTYKNNEAKRKGLHDNESDSQSSSSAYVPPLDPNPDLKSFPAPPRRNTAGSAVAAQSSQAPPSYPVEPQQTPQAAQYGQPAQQNQQPQQIQQDQQAQQAQQPQLQNYGQQYAPQPPQVPSRALPPPPGQNGQDVQNGQSGQSGLNAQSGQNCQNEQFTIPPAITNAFSLAVAGAVTQTINQSANQMVQNYSGQSQQVQQTQKPQQTQPEQSQQVSGQSQLQNRFQQNLLAQFTNQIQNSISSHFSGQPAQQEPVQTNQVNHSQALEAPQPVAPATTPSQPVYYQAPGTAASSAGVTAAVSPPAVTSPPSVTSPVAEEPKKWAKTTKAGHYETGEDGEERYIPKPAPDASKFAPPPIHRARGSNSASPAPVAKPQPVSAPYPPSTISPAVSANSTGRAPPALPTRTETGTSTATQSLITQSSTKTNAPVLPTSPKADGGAPSHAPIKFVDIDINKFGPPPPRIFRGNEPAASKLHESRGHTLASLPPAHAPAQAPQGVSAPPPLPTRHSALNEVPKKTPPPKPAKPVKPPKPLFGRASTSTGLDESVPSSPPPPYAEMSQETDAVPRELPEESASSQTPLLSATSSSAPSVPNFAAQIAKLRNTSITDAEAAPPKPVRPTKPEIAKKPAPPKPSKPPVAKKPETLVSSAPDVDIAPPPMPLRPNEETPPPMPARHVSVPKVEIEPAAEAIPVKPASPVKKGPPPKPAKLQSQAQSQLQSEKVPPPVVPRKLTPSVIDESAKSSPAPTPPPSRTLAPLPPPSRSPAPKKEATPPPPPPPRNYTRPAAEPPKAASGPPDLDLELASGWFANTTGPLELPRSLVGLNYSSSYLYSTRSTPVGNLSDHTREMNVTLKDLAKVTYQITWKNNDASTATAQVSKFVPSPIETKKLTKQELVACSQQFGDHVAAWCLHREGEQVGSGECWDLAHHALLKGCGKHAFVSAYYHHGYPILEIHGSSSGSRVVRGPEDEVRKGDILQFTTANFENRATGSFQTAGDPNHTSVVIDKIGEKILVAEQNVQGVRKVVRGEYVLSNIVAGSVVVYRPVPASWAE